MDALSNSFRETPPTVRELALSGADRFVDSALWETDVFGKVSAGAQAHATASHFYGVYLGLKDPRVIAKYLSDFARENADRRHEGR
jgi:hypothetical protein